jgi:hypothetical protein
MKKLNSFSSVDKGFKLLLVFSMCSLFAVANMNPVRINFFYVASTVAKVNPDTFPGWNTVSFHQIWHSRSGLTNMKDMTGVPTKLRIKVTTDFYGYNTSGASSKTMNMTDSVSKSNFYGNSTSKGGVTLYGLDPTLAYKISIFGSRNGTTSTADVVYTLNDALGSKLVLSCANNVTGLAIFNNIIPNADSTLVISLDKGLSNTIGFTYLAAMKVEETATTPLPFSPVMINFGTTSPVGWNSLITYTTSGSPLTNMIDTGGNTTNVGLKVATSFSGIIGTTGMASTTTPLNMTDEVSQSNIFKSASGGALSITGLPTANKYKITIFGSRGGLTDVRNVDYVLTGVASNTVTLDVANNAANVAVFDNITTNSEGGLGLVLNFGLNNTTYTYINAMKIETSSTATGVSAVEVNNKLKAYVVGEKTVRMSWDNNMNINSLVRLYNAQGKLLQNVSVSGSNTVDLDVENSGMYIVKVQSGNNSWVTKFVK